MGVAVEVMIAEYSVDPAISPSICSELLLYFCGCDVTGKATLVNEQGKARVIWDLATWRKKIVFCKRLRLALQFCDQAGWECFL